MPEKKDSAAAVLTGSTGNAAQDAPPRVLFVTFAGGITTAVCAIAGVDAVLTGTLVTTAAAGAGLLAVAWDQFVKPRLS